MQVVRFLDRFGEEPEPKRPKREVDTPPLGTPPPPPDPPQKVEVVNNPDLNPFDLEGELGKVVSSQVTGPFREMTSAVGDLTEMVGALTRTVSRLAKELEKANTVIGSVAEPTIPVVEPEAFVVAVADNPPLKEENPEPAPMPPAASPQPPALPEAVPEVEVLEIPAQKPVAEKVAAPEQPVAPAAPKIPEARPGAFVVKATLRALPPASSRMVGAGRGWQPPAPKAPPPKASPPPAVEPTPPPVPQEPEDDAGDQDWLLVMLGEKETLKVEKTRLEEKHREEADTSWEILAGDGFREAVDELDFLL